MQKQFVKAAVIILALILGLLIAWHAIDVFMIAFAAILLAILLNAIGRGAQVVTRLPYPVALSLSIVIILGILTLTFWLYSPLISDQFRLLLNQLPGSLEMVKDNISTYFGENFLSNETFQKEFSLTNEKFLTKILTVFSVTIGSIVNFIIFIVVGLYLALNPSRYFLWFLQLFPAKRRKHIWKMMKNIGGSLHWWILGKLLSMTVVGVATFIGLRLLNVSLAFILGLLAGLLTFIPYVGAIISAIPAILISFTQEPLLAMYVGIVYLGIHLVEGYMITPFIEQRTASIPPAFTILVQILLLTLIGPIGFALATPLAVLGISIIQSTRKREMDFTVD